MWKFARQHWKRLLFAASAVVLFPLTLISLLLWDSRPKPDADVSIHYLKTVAQDGSNIVMFAVTNRSDFPVSHVVAFLAPHVSTGTGWQPHFFIVSSRPWPGPMSQTARKSNSVISVAAYSTNKWKAQLLGSDARPEVMAKSRAWIAWRLRKLNFDWSWRLQGRIQARKAQVNAYGPEMFGDAPAP